MNPMKGRFCNRNLAEGRVCKVNLPKRRRCDPVPGGGEGNRCGSCWSRQSPWAGGGCRPRSVVPQLCFWLGYVASQSLSFPVCSWGDGSMNWLVICSEQGRKGSCGNLAEHHLQANHRSVFRVRKANPSMFPAEPGMVSVWWILLFPESGREKTLVDTGRFIPHLEASGPQDPAAPKPCVWDSERQAGQASLLISPLPARIRGAEASIREKQGWQGSIPCGKTTRGSLYM